MPELNLAGLKNANAWEKAGIALPQYDIEAMRVKTEITPRWVHFGAGNIFRGYIAVIADDLLNQGAADTGIIAVEAFDTDILEKIFKPCDNLALSVSLYANGSAKKRVVGSVAKALTNVDFDALAEIFRSKSLQIVSFTITEKGYDGDIITLAARLLYERCKTGEPVAFVSMDNFQENGDKLKKAVLERTGQFGGLEFISYINEFVTFPWSMIDKITPRPSEKIGAALKADGIDGMEAVVTSKNTYIAPFVNSEAAEYLVIEDNFPNGRPPLEKAGVYMTDRETVSLTEKMKVTACLNPLHTALAVFGCLLGYTSISEEMKDAALLALVKKIGYDEGLPTVTDPKIIDPKAFIDEVIGERLPNPFIPDTPQRIATDTSHKIPIRFCHTIREAQKRGTAAQLIGIPLAIAGWLRYLKGTDDNHAPFTLSPDPLLDELKGKTPEEILSMRNIFGADLSNGGLDRKILAYYKEMEELGGVRKTLSRELQ